MLLVEQSSPCILAGNCLTACAASALLLRLVGNGQPALEQLQLAVTAHSVRVLPQQQQQAQEPQRSHWKCLGSASEHASQGLPTLR